TDTCESVKSVGYMLFIFVLQAAAVTPAPGFIPDFRIEPLSDDCQPVKQKCGGTGLRVHSKSGRQNEMPLYTNQAQ
ncbi:hypothetical protein ACMWQW_31185, partial [Escherichia coli]